jgi:hypothetical protein
MLNKATTDIAGCVKQINALVEAGADLVRLAVPTHPDGLAFAKIVQKVKIPLIADIHFSPDRAIEAIEGGAAKIRLNPGNIKSKADIDRIIDCAKAHKIAIRIGINEASIRDLKHDIPYKPRTALMLKEMAGYVRHFESRGFDSIVLERKRVRMCCDHRIEQGNRGEIQISDTPRPDTPPALPKTRAFHRLSHSAHYCIRASRYNSNQHCRRPCRRNRNRKENFGIARTV